jgi:hypothetical protein
MKARRTPDVEDSGGGCSLSTGSSRNERSFAYIEQGFRRRVEAQRKPTCVRCTEELGWNPAHAGQLINDRPKRRGRDRLTFWLFVLGSRKSRNTEVAELPRVPRVKACGKQRTQGISFWLRLCCAVPLPLRRAVEPKSRGGGGRPGEAFPQAKIPLDIGAGFEIIYVLFWTCQYSTEEKRLASKQEERAGGLEGTGSRSQESEQTTPGLDSLKGEK